MKSQIRFGGWGGVGGVSTLHGTTRKSYAAFFFLTPKAMRKIRRGFPRHILPLLALRVEPCGKSVDNFGTPRSRALPWVKGMDDVSRKTEGIRPLKGPELTRNSVSSHVSCGSHGAFAEGATDADPNGPVPYKTRPNRRECAERAWRI